VLQDFTFLDLATLARVPPPLAGNVAVARLTLLASDLLAEIPSSQATQQLGLPQSASQNLLSTVATRAAVVASLCRTLNWPGLQAAFLAISQRAAGGGLADAELASLSALKGVGPARARMLRAAGFSRIEDLAHTTPAELASRVRLGPAAAVLAVQIVSAAQAFVQRA
jgi:predicted flap endonuclease-1-like 5' DNA nuclease